ncbi:universal stress protein [Rhodococcus sp. ABRD24]|nr:universal stress protein [Rhodococcus sp. ABRD24]
MLPGPDAIVVGVDESDSAFDALHWAARVAGRRAAPLHVVHALPTPGVFLSEAAVLIQAQFTETLQEAAKQVLARARTAMESDHPDVAFTTGAYPGPSAAALIDVSEDAALLVLGATGSGSIGTALVGSTGQRVANHSRCPVTICRGGRHAAADTRPVVVGVDGSELSVRAVGAAFEYASLFDVPLIVVHAWGSDRTADPHSASRLADWAAIETAERAVVSESIAGWVEDYPDVEIVTELNQAGAGRLLLAYAKQAQLVVVGSRGRSRLAGVLLGSTSQNLVHHAPCPVMICRDPTR